MMRDQFLDTLVATLRKANSRGHLGYAYGNGDEDLPIVHELLRRGLIVFWRDASPGPLDGQYGQKRDLYKLTNKGQRWRAGATGD